MKDHAGSFFETFPDLKGFQKRLLYISNCILNLYFESIEKEEKDSDKYGNLNDRRMFENAAIADEQVILTSDEGGWKYISD